MISTSLCSEFSYLLSTIIFFFFMSRRPSSPPLFPSTTLFRSSYLSPPYPSRSRREAHGRCSASSAKPIPNPYASLLKRDRKSTRLNSSHVAISYAVFCLKKKTHRRHTTASFRPQDSRILRACY